MKKLLAILLSAITVFAAALCGCAFSSGKDGRDGQDLNIYDIYDAANEAREAEGLPALGFLDFLNEYFAQSNFEYNEAESVRTVVNRSLLSAVAIFTGFTYNYSRLNSTVLYFTGGGVIVELDKEQGNALIVTNCHVIYDDITDGKHSDGSTVIPSDGSVNPVYADEISVHLYGNDLYLNEGAIPAKVVGATANYDIALLSVTGSEIIKNSDVIAASFSADENTYIGTPVYAIGNPEADGISATSGIVSRDSEVIPLSLITGGNTYYYRVIRTDAAVNGGNSGGGLFDGNGKILGIVNSRVVSSDVENMGYALPASTVKRLVGLIKDGYSSSASPTLKRAVFSEQYYGYTTSNYYDNEENVLRIVDKITVNAPYYGMSAGDVILKIAIKSGTGTIREEVEITRRYNLDDVLLSAREGDTVIFTVLRGGEEKEVEVRPYFDYCD